MTEPLVSPPRARLAFRVSVVGHQPDRMPKDAAGRDALGGRIAAVLEAASRAVRAFQARDTDARLYAAEPPLLRAISPLAEGCDRMFAEAALARGYVLTCPMPFAQGLYEGDFAPAIAREPGSHARVRGNLRRARDGAGLETFELDGERASPAAISAARADAASVVLNQSDLMVFVWDGERTGGAGASLETLREAISYHVPVVWIDAVAPFAWMVVRAEADLDCLKAPGRCSPAETAIGDGSNENQELERAVERIVREEIDLPATPRAADARGAPTVRKPRLADEAHAHAHDYFAERRPPLDLFFLWKWFRDLVGDFTWRVPRLITRDFISVVRDHWPINAAEASRAPERPMIFWVNGEIRDHFAWSDQLADNYADAYRSAFLLSYLLSAAAVLVAMLPRAMGSEGGDAAGTLARGGWSLLASGCGELALLVTIVALLVAGRRLRWHERWMEYRVLAELIRELKFLAPLGGGRPLPRTPTHLAVYGDPAQTWMYWHLRAIARATGLPTVRASPEYLMECLDLLVEIADDPANGQRAFHETNCKRYEHLHERLHGASIIVFAVTVVAIVLNLSLHQFGQAAGPKGLGFNPRGDIFILFSAFLPAFAAALAGINNHGEFLRISKRSRAMADGFAQFAGAIRALRRRLRLGERVSLAEVTPLASKMAETMVDEVIDWRVVVLDRPQTAG